MTTFLSTDTVHTHLDTAVGDLTLVRRGATLCGVYFPHHWTRPDPAGFGRREDAGFEAVSEQVHQYLAGQRRHFDLLTAAAGTAEQRAVWQLLGEIPYGTTTSYGALSARLGMDPREVGAAVGANPLSIVVPCHRVVGVDGRLTGYAGGLERKRFLLDLESGSSRLF